MANMLRIRTVLSGWSGGPGLSTFYFDPGAGAEPAAAIDCVARVRQFWSAISALFPTSFSAQVQPNVDQLDETTGSLTASYVGGAPVVVAGASGTAYNAYATMVLLRQNTGVIRVGRRVVGRTFVGPVTSTVDSGGNPLASNVTTMLTAATVMLTGSTGAIPEVWHRPKPAGSATGREFYVVNYTAAPYFAVLRSRRD